MNKEIEHMKAVILRHKRKMKAKEDGDGIMSIALVCLFLMVFGMYLSCLTTIVVTK